MKGENPLHKPKRLISVLLVFLMLLSLSGTYLSVFEGADTSGYAFAYANEKNGNTASNTDKAAAEDSKQTGSAKGETTAPASNTDSGSKSNTVSAPESNDKSSTDTKTDKTDKTEPVSTDRSEDTDAANDASDAQKEEASVSERVLTVEAKSEAAFEKDSEGNKKETAASKAARYFWKALTGRVVSHEKESDDGAYTVVIKGKLPEDVKAEAKYIEFDDADAYDKYGESAFFALNLTLTDADGNNYIPEEPLDITVSGFRIAESAKANDHFTLYSYEENYDRAKKYDRYSADVLAFDSEYTGNDSVTNRSYKVYDSSKEYKNGEDAVRYTEDSDGLAVTKKNEIEFTYAYGTSLDDSKEGEDAIVDSARFVLSARKLKKAEASKEEQKVIKAGRITASDGKAYSITVSYGKSAGIHEGAELKVKEITEKDKAYDAYMDASAEILNAKKKDFVIARAFDISIVDPETGKEYQPDDNVSVRIRLIDENVKWRSDIKIVHFEDSKGNDPAKGAELLEGKVLLTKAIEFKTDGFSVFAVIGSPEGDQAQTDPENFSVKYLFRYENGDPYTFRNENGIMVDYQFVPNGEAPYSPGTPSDKSLNKQGYAFKGWYEKKLIGGWADEPTIDANGVGKTVTGITNFTTVKTLYPRFEKVKHVYYYDESATGDPTKDPVYMIDVVDESEIIGNKYDTKTSDGEYRVNYLPSVSSKAFLGWSDQPGKYLQSDVKEKYDFPPDTSSDLIRLYPVVADVYWITFDKNDWKYIPESDPAVAEWKQESGKWVFVGHNNGGTHIRKGTGALYVAPIHVLKGQTIREAGYTELPTTTRPGYDFVRWNLPNGNQLTLNYKPTSDITVTARWTPSSVQNYSVVFWRQNASDDVDASPKTYYYDHTDIRQGTTGSIVSLTNADKNGYGTGFEFNAASSTTSAEVMGDGSTVLNVYYDRRVYELAFQVDGYYTPTSSTSGTLYGRVNGEYVELHKSSNRFYYYSYEPYTGTSEGYYYIPDSDNEGEYKSAYCMYYDGSWIYQRGYSWYYVPRGVVYVREEPEYTGQRYTRSSGYHTIKTIRGIYGHNIRDQFPIQGDDGTSYAGYTWTATDTSIYEYVLETIETIPAGNVTFHGKLSGTEKSIFYYLEALPGEEYEREFKGRHYNLYKTVLHNFNYITYTEEFYKIEGFDNQKSFADPYFGQDRFRRSDGTYYWDEGTVNAGSNSNQAPIKYSNKSNYLYYNRNQYKLEFYNGHETDKSKIAGAEADVYYEESLQSYADWFTVSEDGSSITYNGHTLHYEGYVFDGWYKDDMCTEKFNFDEETMPAHPMKLYAGWKKLRYRVWVQPNGGVLSESESTYFKVDWGETISEYTDVAQTGRKYTEATDGLYSYVYNDSTDPEHYPDARVAYYALTSELGLKQKQFNGETIEYDERVMYDPEKKYTPVPDTTYSFIGWYKVKGDIDDDVAPDIGRDVDGVWNFNTPVKENTAIKAMWRRNGTFSIKYDKDMTLPDGTKIEGTLPYPISDDNVYIDLAQAVAPGAVAPPADSNYIFVGWKTPDGEVHQPGQVFTVKSDYATEDPNEQGHYIYRLEPKFVMLGTSTLQYDLNGGSYDEGKNMTDLGEVYDSGSAYTKDYDRRRVTGITKNTKIKLSDARDASNKLPTKKGFVFTGWNSKKDPEAAGAIHYDISGIYGISGEVNTLYAEWTPICFDFDFTKFAEEYDPATDTSKYDNHLNGAEFKLSATTDNNFADMTSTSATINGTVGVVKFETVAPRSNRSLSITETRAPVGYTRNKTEYSITGWKEPQENYTSRDKIGYTIVTIGGKKYVRTEDDSDIEITDPDGVVIDNSDKDHKIINEVAFNTVELLKFDRAKTNKHLAKARFQVTRKKGNEDIPYIRGNHQNGIYITGDDGIAEMNLMPGEYTVTELKAPAGYERLSYDDGEYLKINVTENGTVTLSHKFDNVTIENRPDPSSEGRKIHTIKVPNVYKPGRKVILRKVSTGSYDPVQGERFNVLPISGNDPVKADGKELKNLTSGADGIIWIGILPYGKYKVVETSKNNIVFEIEVNADHVVSRDVSKNN